MKYTLEYLKKNKIAVKITDLETGRKIAEIIGGKQENLEKYFDKLIANWFFVFDVHDYNLYIISEHSSFIKDHKIITPEEFLSGREKEKNTLDKYFAVFNDGSEEFNKYINWLNNKYSTSYGGLIEAYYGYGGEICDTGTGYHTSIKDFKNKPTIYTPKEIMQIINKQKEKTMEAPKTFSIRGKERHLKAILEDLKEMGYVDNEQFPYKSGDKQISLSIECVKNKNDLKNFKSIGEFSKYSTWELNFNLPEDYSKVLEHAKEAINSEYWKTKEKVFSVGNQFDVIIKDGKVFHKNSDITRFVTEMVDYFHKSGHNLGNYKAFVEEVTFSSVGCEKVKTNLSDWIKVYNEWKNC